MSHFIGPIFVVVALAAVFVEMFWPSRPADGMFWPPPPVC